MRKLFAFIILILGIATLIYLIDDKFYSTKSIVYSVDDDKIKVTLQIKDGYKLNGKKFAITDNRNTIYTTGEFLEEGVFYETIDKISKSDNVRIIEDISLDTIQYVFYSVNEQEFVYLIKVLDTNAYLSLTNNVSLESAIKVFNRLTIEKA